MVATQICFYFFPYFGEDEAILTNIFQSFFFHHQLAICVSLHSTLLLGCEAEQFLAAFGYKAEDP